MPISSIEPYGFENSKNGRLLALLGVLTGAQVRARKKVPIPSDADFSPVVAVNNNRMKSSSGEVFRAGNAASDSEQPAAVASIPQSLVLMNFVEISSFLPSNLQEQVCTVTITGFPLVQKLVTENIILQMLPKIRFSWSAIDNTKVENRLVFMRFASVEELRWFSSPSVLQLFQTTLRCSVTFDPASISHLNDVAEVEYSAPNTIASILAVNNEDSAGSYYQYNVVEAELVEVPKDIKEQTRRDIVRFRTKVLKDEKENRRREAEAERIRAKSKLKELFLDAVQQQNEQTDVAMAEVDEHEELDDVQYGAFVESEKQKKYQDAYEAKAALLAEREVSQRDYAAASLEKERNYEQKLLDNKLESMRHWRNFDETSSNYESSRVGLFFTDRPEYLRLRLKEREKEEAMDAADEEEESRENSAPEKAAKFMAAMAPEKIMTKPPKSKQPLDFSAMDGDLWQKRIGDLVEEFLGVKEDFVISFIYKHLLAHGFNKNEELADELTEILDDDAKTVVQMLEEYAEEVGMGAE